MALLNVFFGVLMVLFAAVYVWLSFGSSRIADGHVSKPELIPNAVYQEGKCDKLRDVAVSCYKFQDDLFITSLRANAKNARETAWILGGLGALLLLNAWAFRTLSKVDEKSRSNM